MPRLAPLLVTTFLLASLDPLAPAAMSQTTPAGASSDAPADAEHASEPGFASPRLAFDVAKVAFNERRWDGFLDCVASDQQPILVGEMVSAFEIMRQQPEADPQVAQLMGRFFPAGVPADAVSQHTPTRRAATAGLVAALESPAEFFGAATDLAMVLEHGANAAKVSVQTLGDLRPVKTEQGASNRAVQAEVSLRLPGAKTPRRDVWTFVATDKRWYLAPLGLE